MLTMSIAQLNNTAALMMEKEQYRQAICSLREANKLLVVVHQEADDKAEESTSQDDGIAVYDYTRSAPANASTPLQKHLKRPQHEDDFHRRSGRPSTLESATFIYQNPIYVSALPETRSESILSAIVLFNMALAYNMLGVQMKKSNPLRRRLLRESLKLYQLTFVMKSRGRLHFDTTFALALVNNTAHIQREMGREEKAKKLTDLMMSTLMMVVLNGQTASVPQMDGFMATASSLVVHPDNMAPAA